MVILLNGAINAGQRVDETIEAVLATANRLLHRRK